MESSKQERSNLLNDNPIAARAGGSWISKHSIAAGSPLQQGGSGKSPLYQDKKSGKHPRDAGGRAPEKKEGIKHQERLSRGSRRPDGSIVGGISGATKPRKSSQKKPLGKKSVNDSPTTEARRVKEYKAARLADEANRADYNESKRASKK